MGSRNTEYVMACFENLMGYPVQKEVAEVCTKRLPGNQDKPKVRIISVLMRKSAPKIKSLLHFTFTWIKYWFSKYIIEVESLILTLIAGSHECEARELPH
jgi:hypothetical protein